MKFTATTYWAPDDLAHNLQTTFAYEFVWKKYGRVQFNRSLLARVQLTRKIMDELFSTKQEILRIIPCPCPNLNQPLPIKEAPVFITVDSNRRCPFESEALPSSWQFKTSLHYSDVIMSSMASQITINSVSIVCSIVYSGADQRKHKISVSLAFVRGIHRWPMDSPLKGPLTRKMFPFDDVIMSFHWTMGDVGIIFENVIFEPTLIINKM